MGDRIHFVGGEAGDHDLSADEAAEAARRLDYPILFGARDRASARVAAELVRQLPDLIRARLSARQERRIEGLIDHMLDVDPFDRTEAEIDIDNARLRADFLREVDLLDSAAVHRRSGHSGRNTAQTAAVWRRAGRIFGVPHQGRLLFPAFQFDADGRPLPLVKEVLAALPEALTPWQTAFWFMAPDPWLDGAPPRDALLRGDPAVVEAARHAGRLPVG
jgi:hypothetical protein